MWKTIKESLLALVTILAALFTVIGFTTNAFKSIEGSELVAVLLLGVLCVYYLCDNLRMKVRWSRDIKYGECLAIVDCGFQALHTLIREKKGNDAYLLTIMRACNHFAEAFSILSSCKCSIAVKILVEEKTDDGLKVHVLTLCRDDWSREKRQNLDNKELKHYIEDNTDYANILSKYTNDDCFFCNRLPYYSNYANSSFMVDGHPKDTEPPFPFNMIHKWWKWPLPYKSTIVVPVCPAYRRQPNNIVGFLCVASSSLGAFKERYDVELLHGMAEGMYNVIHLYRDSVEERLGLSIP